MSANCYSATDLPLIAGRVRLEADLIIPARARGLIIFVHGRGSTRHTFRNCDVAARLRTAGYGTLLFDLLSRSEAAFESIEPRIGADIALMARRLVAATRWAHEQTAVSGLPVGFFGADTGGSAIFSAAAEIPELVDAVVARGSRPDLAGSELKQIFAPTLLLVGGWDDAVLQANRAAFAELRCEKRLVVVPQATHRFEEPGALQRVADLAAAWFETHLPNSKSVEATSHTSPDLAAALA